MDCFESEQSRVKRGTVGREGSNNLREAGEERRSRLFYSPGGGYIFCGN